MRIEWKKDVKNYVSAGNKFDPFTALKATDRRYKHYSCIWKVVRRGENYSVEVCHIGKFVVLLSIFQGSTGQSVWLHKICLPTATWLLMQNFDSGVRLPLKKTNNRRKTMKIYYSIEKYFRNLAICSVKFRGY